MNAAIAVHPERALRAARELWSRAAFEHCLETLDALEASGGLTGSAAADVLVLRAFALWRTRAFSAMVACLDVDPRVFADPRDAARVRLMLAAGLTRSGQPDRALALLAELRRTPGAVDTPDLEAQCAYHEGYAYFVAGDDVTCEERASIARAYEHPTWSIHARSTLASRRLRRGEYHEALALFRETVAAYQRGGDRDDVAEALYHSNITQLELVLRSAEVRDTRPVRRRSALDYTASKRMRFLGHITFGMDAWLAALDGDRAEALRLSRRAVDLADSPARLVWALGQRALLADVLANREAALDYANEALQLCRRIDWARHDEFDGHAPVLVAETLATRNPAAARELLGMVEIALRTLDPNTNNRDDDRIAAHFAFIDGLARRTDGDLAGAHRSFLDASNLFARISNHWRVARTLVELDTVPMPGGDAAAHLDRAARLVRSDYPASFLADRLGPWLRAYDDPIVAAFSPMRRHVLRRLLDGVSPKETAALLGLAIGTVRNHIGEIQAAFGAHSMQELIVAARRRGIGPPNPPYGSPGVPVVSVSAEPTWPRSG
ncbi:MAG TPA: helix-turn-helix domain-containing protein [Candidatus Sulfotelmatobacter sp.]|nr:helix-turn-helix domain-containing protein [Candidatus Sulfotelmatobacter sp.]